MILRYKKTGFVLSALVIAIFLLPACKGRGPKATCTYGNDLSDEEIFGMMDEGEKVIGFVMNQEYTSLYEATSQITKKSQTRDQFVTVLKRAEESFGKIEYPRLEEAYLIETRGKEDELIPVSCNLGVKGVDDIHHVGGNQRIAVLVYNATGNYVTLRVVLHLIWEDENWKLLSLVPNPASLRGHMAGYYFNKARESREKNLLRVASLQYQLAMILSDMGPNIEEFAVRQTAKEAQEIRVDYMPQNMVQIWEASEGKAFKVYNIGVTISKGDIFVEIMYLRPSLSDTDQIEKA